MKPGSRSGFTLIELLISLAIFTIIGLATARQIQQIVNTKNSAFEDLDAYNALRAAVSLMKTDISQAFHVRYDDLGEENKQALFANQAIPHTVFDGRKKELIFTSVSHRNFYAERKECEQTEISFFLHGSGRGKYQSLMKRESDILDADPYQGGGIYTLLDNVTELEFWYWDAKTGKWVDDWNSDGAQRDLFPEAVRVRIAVLGPRNQKLVVDTNFKLAFPNNKAFLVKLGSN